MTIVLAGVTQHTACSWSWSWSWSWSMTIGDGDGDGDLGHEDGSQDAQEGLEDGEQPSPQLPVAKLLPGRNHEFKIFISKMFCL